MRLEELVPGAAVRGLLHNSQVTVVNLLWFGSAVVEVTYKNTTGVVASQLLYRDDEPRLDLVAAGRPWSFDADGALFRLAAEAQRIRLAHLFDPILAVHTSDVEPLPHQITAVYDAMLPCQPLRFLLADDPGAGKTVMTGLFIRELLIRGDLQCCLIVCPGNLVEQWQEELARRFHLDFILLTRESFAAARSGNPFQEGDRFIARLDHLARNEEAQALLTQTDWDLVVCDEAHKMSASSFGDEVKETRRYKLGKLLATHCRHFLLLTATPHNGKEEDFQRFMALLDADRFEGRPRDGRASDSSDLMRRLLKEQLLKFDGTPLFPERRAYSVHYTLSDLEAALYTDVTAYVREEMNRAERLIGEERRRVTVGFALTILQRRLASSPEAILRSLERRHERLRRRLHEEDLARRAAPVRRATASSRLATPLSAPDDPDGLHTIREEILPYLTADDLDDLDEAPESEVEQLEAIADKATAARNLAELRLEIAALERLEELARRVRQAGTDRKWEQLSNLLQGNPAMFDLAGRRRKLIIFTEHRDTLTYLATRLSSLLGRPGAVVVIHGSLGRDARREAQSRFTQDPEVEILVATDAAGEGVNLQRAHLMVNYDLPWNPNRLEQRFGRIHRIGQQEVCHLWNLVAPETREGDVFARLFAKLEREREALGGQVFDVLGKVFTEQSLRDLLIQAIREGDDPAQRAKLDQVVEGVLDRDHLRVLLAERALDHASMDYRQVLAIKEAMDLADARRLQPHFIASFFLEAFRLLGGNVREREHGRYELSHVPGQLRERDQALRAAAWQPRNRVQERYERITFEKVLVAPRGLPLADLVCPGHPLLDAVIDLMLERHRDLLRRGATLADPADSGSVPRLLVTLEHAISDGRLDATGRRRVVSQRLEFVELLPDGSARAAGPAPYLDYQPLPPEDVASLRGRPPSAAMLPIPADGDGDGSASAGNPGPSADVATLLHDPEGRALTYAVTHLVPDHLRDVREAREDLIRRTMAAVKERLTREIRYWDHRADDLEEQERAGKQPRLNATLARRRADDLAARLQRRMEELDAERQLAALPPAVIGAALILPAGLLPSVGGPGIPSVWTADPVARARVERLAVEAVLAAERRLGRDPRDVGAEHRGYDVESRTPDGRLLFIEVKGRVVGADNVTVTRNEILTALNAPDRYILALVRIADRADEPRYLRHPFGIEPDFAVTSVNYHLPDLLDRAEAPS